MIKKIFIKRLKKNSGPFSPRKAKFIIWVARLLRLISDYKYKFMRQYIHDNPVYVGFVSLDQANVMTIINPENIPSIILRVVKKNLDLLLYDTGIDIDGDIITCNDTKLYVNLFDGIIERVNEKDDNE